MDLVVGQKATRSITLTTEHVKRFAELTGDYNPLHFDEAFAAKTKFKHLVVQGGLSRVEQVIPCIWSTLAPPPNRACYISEHTALQ